MYQATPVTAEDIEKQEAGIPVVPEEILLNVSRSRGFSVSEPDLEEMSKTEDRINSIFSEYKVKLEERTKLHLGYPYNLDFDFSALQSLQDYSINNLGDPWVESNYV
jgi:hypothetical protein